MKFTIEIHIELNTELQFHTSAACFFLQAKSVCVVSSSTTVVFGSSTTVVFVATSIVDISCIKK